MITGPGITIDDVHYTVGIEYDSINRSFTIIEGNNAGTSLTASTIRDILGTGYTYEMTFHPISGYEKDYSNFYLAITAPNESVTVTLPFGQSTISFKAKVSSSKDTFHGNYAGKNLWKSLQVKFEYIEPYYSLMA